MNNIQRMKDIIKVDLQLLLLEVQHAAGIPAIGAEALKQRKERLDDDYQEHSQSRRNRDRRDFGRRLEAAREWS